jgi:hypothetical protein
MTETAWRQGAKNALIVVLLCLIANVLLQQILVSIYRENPAEASRDAFAVFWGFVLVIALATWIYGRSIAGRLLLDCGPNPGQKGNFILAILMLGVTLWHSRSCYPISLSAVFGLNGLWSPASLAAFFFVAAFGRLQVRENGIITYWSLLSWRRIASYRWADDGTLLIAKKQRLSLRVALPVPPEQKQAVDELLTTFCPGRDAASVPGT